MMLLVSTWLLMIQASSSADPTTQEIIYFFDDFETCQANTNCVQNPQYGNPGVGTKPGSLLSQVSQFSAIGNNTEAEWDWSRFSWQAYSGSYSIDMSGNDNQLGALETTATISLPPKLCTLSFALSGNNYNGFNSVKNVKVEVLSVKVDNSVEVIASQNFLYDPSIEGNVIPYDMRYKIVSLNFTGAAQTKLRFTSISDPGYGAIIDHVKVVGPPFDQDPPVVYLWEDFESCQPNTDCNTPDPSLRYLVQSPPQNVNQFEVISETVDYASNSLSFQSYSGNWSLDLCGLGASNGVIQTTNSIRLPSKPCLLRFALSGNLLGQPPEKSFLLEILEIDPTNGSATVIFRNVYSYNTAREGNTPTDMKWKLINVEFTGAPLIKIRFTSTGSPQGAGALIDLIKVYGPPYDDGTAVAYFYDGFETCLPYTNCMEPPIIWAHQTVGYNPTTGAPYPTTVISKFAVKTSSIDWCNPSQWPAYRGNRSVEIDGVPSFISSMQTFDTVTLPANYLFTLQFAITVNSAGPANIVPPIKYALVELSNNLTSPPSIIFRNVFAWNSVFKSNPSRPNTDMRYEFYRADFRTTAPIQLSILVATLPPATGYGLIVDEFSVIGPPTNRPPYCAAASVSPPFLWPPNERKILVNITNITDPDGDDFKVQIISVFQNELDVQPAPKNNGIKSGPNAEILPPDLFVKAKVNPEGNGRVYIISFKATDTQGASCNGKVFLCVPIDALTDPTCPFFNKTGDSVLYDSTIEQSAPCTDPKCKVKNPKVDRRRRS